MIRLEEIAARLKERIDNNHRLQEFTARAKAKAEEEKKARLEAQAQFTSTFLNTRMNSVKGNTDTTSSNTAE